MRTSLGVGAVVAALALPAASEAQLALGLRVGYASPAGDEYSTNGVAARMSDGVEAQLPIQLDAAFRITPEVAVGGYFSYGFVRVGGDLADECDTLGLDCSGRSYRLGVQGAYAFTRVSPRFVPWAGAGIGYEWSSVTAEGFGLEREDRLDGWEFLNLQIGGDWKLGSSFALGPYLMYSFGKYSSGTTTLTGAPDVDVFATADTEMHQWFGFGVRGKLDL